MAADEHAIAAASYLKRVGAACQQPTESNQSSRWSISLLTFVLHLPLTSKFFLTSAFPADSTAGVEVAAGTMMCACERTSVRYPSY